MWSFMNRSRLCTKNKQARCNIPARHATIILDGEAKLSPIDKKFIKLILNFTPKWSNLKCEITRYDRYSEYMENIRGFIYCEATIENWKTIENNLIELDLFIKHESARNREDFNAFLHMIEVQEEDYGSIADTDIVNRTIDYINNTKHDYQSSCQLFSNIYLNMGCSINDYTLIWGDEHCINLLTESYG